MQEVDAAISTDGATKKAPNGATNFWPNKELLLQEASGGGAAYSSRALLRFGGVGAFVPPGATMTSVQLAITCTNSDLGVAADGEGFLLTQVIGFGSMLLSLPRGEVCTGLEIWGRQRARSAATDHLKSGDPSGTLGASACVLPPVLLTHGADPALPPVRP